MYRFTTVSINMIISKNYNFCENFLYIIKVSFISLYSRIYNMNKLTDEEVRNYITNGGTLLNVTKMDSYRDGGTKVIKCNYSHPIKYFIHMDNWTIHSGYPTTDENLVTDEFLKRYLTQAMKNYTKKLYEQVTRLEGWVYNIEQ